MDLGSIVAGDFNGDGTGDIAVVTESYVQDSTARKAAVLVYPGTGKGYFDPPKRYTIGMPTGMIAAGDVNGDGKIDLVVARSPEWLATSTCPGCAPADLSVLLGRGDGTFQPAMNLSVLGPPAVSGFNFVALADVNRDGKLDLVGDWGVALGTGTGEFPIADSAPDADRSAADHGDRRPQSWMVCPIWPWVRWVTVTLGQGLCLCSAGRRKGRIHGEGQKLASNAGIAGGGCHSGHEWRWETGPDLYLSPPQQLAQQYHSKRTN